MRFFILLLGMALLSITGLDAIDFKNPKHRPVCYYDLARLDPSQKLLFDGKWHGFRSSNGHENRF